MTEPVTLLVLIESDSVLATVEVIEFVVETVALSCSVVDLDVLLKDRVGVPEREADPDGMPRLSDLLNVCPTVTDALIASVAVM